MTELFNVPPDPSQIYPGHHEWPWVLVSILLAVVAAFAALNASARVAHQSSTMARLLWQIISALTLGVGIWAMHFVGMLALVLPCSVQYDATLTMLSMLPSVLASGAALSLVWRDAGRRSLLMRSLLLGAGIGAMHYSGMAAMRLDGLVRYDPGLFVLSLVVAVALSYLALHIRARLGEERKRHVAIVALVMGGAVSGMHYTAMAAASFVRSEPLNLPPAALTPNALALAVATATALLMLASLALAALSRNREMTEQLRASEERWKFALEGSGDCLWDWEARTDRIMYSQRLRDILGYSHEELPDSREAFRALVHPEDLAALDAAMQTHTSGQSDVYRVEYRLRCRDGSWRWILARGKRTDFDAAGVARRMIGTHSDITERKLTEQRIHQLAFFDSLTGLPNRTLLMDRLRQALIASVRDADHGALLFIDLDNFKTLNDSRGHDVGDELLRQVAQRLQGAVRQSDSVARLGGDEFVLVLRQLGDDAGMAAVNAEHIAAKALAALTQPYELGTARHQSSASIGVALFGGRDMAAEDLLKQADMAMYRAKESGRNTVRFFDPDMEATVMRRAALDKDLRLALNEDQFSLHYQAQLTADGHITGAEVLLRWPHPTRGMVPPAEFIALAEDTGLILPLGQWVLHTACRQLAAWAGQPRMAALDIAVNVSPRQFVQTGFVEQVLAVLAQTGADPRRLKLELTEGLFVRNLEQIIETMTALKSHGVGFSMDDFGTGYSSLSFLKRLPLDQLKIDQAFVHDMSDAAIVRTIVTLGISLGLGVIAEGVETIEQRDFLSANGCHVYQGYLFSRPLPLAEFEAFVQAAGRPA